MKFNNLINSLLNEEAISDREKRIEALKALKYTKDFVPNNYRALVDELKDRHHLEELKSLLDMEIRMQDEYNNSSPMYIKALEYAVRELEA